ncbi:MAG: beta-lactamase family protein [Gemmatimonadaceae bacterium]|nr:beta-lactamase family protein [Chitinophagaceae bacterium]
MKIFCIAIALALSSLSLTAQKLVNAAPADANMSQQRLTRIDRTIQEYIDKHWIAGAAAIIVKDGKIVYYKAFGYDDTETKTSLRKDAIFRIASQTKAITSVAAMMLFEEGKFLLDDPLSKYIPEFRNLRVLDKFNEADSSFTTVPAKRQITIRDLLTHTSGIDYPLIGSKSMKSIYTKADIPSGIGTSTRLLATEMKKLAKLPLKHQPGEAWTYGLNSDLLGYLVEVVSGLSLDQFFKQKIFTPLGMNDTYFYIPNEKRARLVKLYTEDSLKRLVKSPDRVGDIVADYPNTDGTFFSGGAGLSSTAYDYAIFLQMLLNGGAYNGNRILSRSSVRMMTMNQIGDINLGNKKFGLGFGITTERESARIPVGAGSFDWGGYFGTTYWADPKEKIAALILTQQSPNSHGDILDKFKVLVYQAINN